MKYFTQYSYTNNPHVSKINPKPLKVTFTSTSPRTIMIVNNPNDIDSKKH